MTSHLQKTFNELSHFLSNIRGCQWTFTQPRVAASIEDGGHCISLIPLCSTEQRWAIGIVQQVGICSVFEQHCNYFWVISGGMMERWCSRGISRVGIRSSLQQRAHNWDGTLKPGSEMESSPLSGKLWKGGDRENRGGAKKVYIHSKGEYTAALCWMIGEWI